MGLVELARRWIEPKPSVSPEAFRKGRPKQNPSIKAEIQGDGTILLVAPLEILGRGYASWLAKRMKAPGAKTFELEPIGAFVWNHCDGKTSFDAISKRLREEYKMNRAEADAALAAFLQMLGRRRLITMEFKR